MPFDHAAAQKNRAESGKGGRRKLTVYDTGEQLEPILWTEDNSPGRLGKVDFENEESVTMLTLEAFPSGIDDATVLQIHDLNGRLTIKLGHNEVITIEEDGTVILP